MTLISSLTSQPFQDALPKGPPTHDGDKVKARSEPGKASQKYSAAQAEPGAHTGGHADWEGSCIQTIADETLSARGPFINKSSERYNLFFSPKVAR